MATFKGADFTIELPNEALDVSSYCFSFPALGEMPPNLTITTQKFLNRPSLQEFVDSRTEPMRETLDDFKVLSEINNQRGNWDYIVSVVSWKVNNSVTRQKRLFIYLSEPDHTIFSLIATDLADNVANSESVFDKIFRSFQTFHALRDVPE